MKYSLLVASLAFVGLLPAASRGDVRLSSLFSDHMVLQKAARVPVWGKADPGEKVSLTFEDQTIKTTAGQDGKWLVVLNLENSPAGPFEVLVKGKNEIKIADVVVGQVWVASGQSNMELTLKNTMNAAKEAATSGNPLLRVFRVAKAATQQPAEECKGSWVVAGPETSGSFTAVGYYFGKILQNKLQTPVGIISTNWGGTPLEAWASQKAIDSVPELKQTRERLWNEQDAYAPAKEKFVKAFEQWAKKIGREDKPTKNVAAFAGENVDADGWTPVKLPGPIKGEGLPESGVIWLRTSIDIPEPLTKYSLPLEFGRVNTFMTFYWNGKPLQDFSYRNFPGKGFKFVCYVPADRLKTSHNVAAFRFYAPGETPQLPDAPRGPMPVPPNWLAKAELALPPLDAAAKAAIPSLPNAPAHPEAVASYLFNGMIHPIIPYAIKGVIWYQGESNAGRAWQYRTAFPLMIEDWREQWNQGAFPFYFCQLANYTPKKPEPGEHGWAELREAQTLALKLPNTGQAILIDIGEAADIHPRNKEEVSERLTRIALAKDYGSKVAYSGPTYESMKVEGNTVRLTFAHADQGLVARPLPATYNVSTQRGETAPLVRNSPNSELEGFAICGSDKKWIWADAKIDGNSIIVWSDKVPKPVAVRYAWAANPTCNLYNGAGLPAGPFRTDNFPLSTLHSKY